MVALCAFQHIIDIIFFCIVVQMYRAFRNTIQSFFVSYKKKLVPLAIWFANSTRTTNHISACLRKCHDAQGRAEHNESQYQAQGSFYRTSHCFPPFLPLWGTVGWADNRMRSSQMALRLQRLNHWTHTFPAESARNSHTFPFLAFILTHQPRSAQEEHPSPKKISTLHKNQTRFLCRVPGHLAKTAPGTPGR